MTSRCPRCGAHLSPVEDAPPAFCGQCGLPQLRVSEGAIAASVPEGDDGHTPHAAFGEQGERRDSAVDWARALLWIGIAAAFGVATPALLPGALRSGAASEMSLLLTPVLTIAVITTYSRRPSRRPVTPGIGARLGATLGLLLGGAVAFLTGVAGFVLRYSYHSHALDNTLNATAAQMIAQLNNSPVAAAPPPPEVIGFLHSPELLAGAYLLGQVLTLVLTILTGAAFGWMTGALFRARRQRHIG